MKLAICDDRPEQLALIRSAAEQYFLRCRGETVSPDCFESSLLFLEQLEKCGGYDIVLLDICMPGMLGTEVAKEIRARHDATEIIFLTTSDEYAVDAFALKAVHYLLKPFTQQQFDEAMDRAMARFASNAAKQLAIKPEGGGVQILDIDEIRYIERQQHTLFLYTKTGIYTETQRSLSRLMEALEALSPGQFLSPYKGYLINQRAITAIEPTALCLQGGVRIPLPRGSYRALQAAYFDYMFPKAETAQPLPGQ